MTNLTPQNYTQEVEQAGLPVLICVHTPDAPPSDALEQLCSHRLKCCRLDASEQEELTQKFRILRLPSALLMQNGQIVQRIQGERSLHDLANILNLN